MIRIGIIGAGGFSYTHKRAIGMVADCEICAVSDLVYEKAEKFAEGISAAVYTDYKEMIAQEKPDGVILNLPHFLHKDVTIECLNLGVPVLVEKPMALTTKECDEMIAVSKQMDVPLAVGHISGYSSSCRELKKIIRDGSLGELCAIDEIRLINYFTNRPEWFLDKKLSGGGILMNLGAHFIDRILYLTDTEPEEVICICNNKLNDKNVEATAQILLKMPGDIGASGTFNGCTGLRHFETTFHFTKGTAQLRLGLELWVSKNGGAYEPVVVGEDVELQDEFMCREIREFVKLICGRPNEAATAEHGRKVVAILEQALN
jgi:predicted dehydrogenase